VQNRRNDEIGALTTEFFVIVSMLHNKNMEKKTQPKYPKNPFFLKKFWCKDEISKSEPRDAGIPVALALSPESPAASASRLRSGEIGDGPALLWHEFEFFLGNNNAATGGPSSPIGVEAR
jgi:hypothetical protein